MKLSKRIQLLIKTMLNDLFGEDPLTEVRQTINGETNAEYLTGLLDEAQNQVDSLRMELGNAVIYQKQIERVWQESSMQLQILEAEVDAAVQNGDDEQARTSLAKLQSAQRNTSELKELVQAGEQRSTDLRVAVSQQQEQLDVLRRRALAVTDREHNVRALSELLGDQQSLTRQTERLHRELTTWEEQIAHREDLLSARREWSK